MRIGVFALAWLIAGPTLAQEATTEPNGYGCTEFRNEMSRALAASPDTLQINNLLFDAARKGCVGAAPMLFAAGASRLARDREGHTALAIAARMGRLPMVEALLKDVKPDEAGLEKADVRGATPLLLAALAGRSAVARRLLDAGAEVNVANDQGETPLTAAAFSRNAELGEWLLARGAKPDVTDRTGKGPMVYAAGQGVDRLAARLLQAGVDPDRRYGADLTALMWAAGHADSAPASGALATVKLLLAKGAKVDLLDDRGRSALMIAASLGHVEIVRTLLAAGADKGLRDKGGKRAADLAVSDELRQLLSSP